MKNKFRDGDLIYIFKGFGKKECKFYYGKKGKIICRDPYFMDYNVRFEDGKEDWFDTKYITKLEEGDLKNGNKKHKNRRF